MAQPKGRRFWEQLVAEVDQGASQSEVARRHEVSQAQLSRWVRRLREEHARRPAPQLLPVRLVGPVLAPRSCRVLLGELGFEFDAGTDPAYVAAIARALRAC